MECCRWSPRSRRRAKIKQDPKTCKRAHHLGYKDALDRHATHANCACRMDPNDVTTEDMDSWEMSLAKRGSSRYLFGRRLAEIAENMRSGVSLPQRQGAKHMPSPMELPGHKLRRGRRWFNRRWRLPLDLSYHPIIPNVDQLMADVGSHPLVDFSVVARLWFMVIARVDDQRLVELII